MGIFMSAYGQFFMSADTRGESRKGGGPDGSNNHWVEL
jgi:hypothetical protein